MTYRFHEREDTGEKCAWCRDNIGPDGKGWKWELNQGRSINDKNGIAIGYVPTNVFIFIYDEIDATAYKLRWI